MRTSIPVGNGKPSNKVFSKAIHHDENCPATEVHKALSDAEKIKQKFNIERR
jgi:hypothetical protein